MLAVKERNKGASSVIVSMLFRGFPIYIRGSGSKLPFQNLVSLPLLRADWKKPRDESQGLGMSTPGAVNLRRSRAEGEALCISGKVMFPAARQSSCPPGLSWIFSQSSCHLGMSVPGHEAECCPTPRSPCLNTPPPKSSY